MFTQLFLVEQFGPRYVRYATGPDQGPKPVRRAMWRTPFDALEPIQENGNANAVETVASRGESWTLGLRAWPGADRRFQNLMLMSMRWICKLLDIAAITYSSFPSVCSNRSYNTFHERLISYMLLYSFMISMWFVPFLDIALPGSHTPLSPVTIDNYSEFS